MSEETQGQTPQEEPESVQPPPQPDPQQQQPAWNQPPQANPDPYNLGPTSIGMPPHVAAGVSYILMWLTGLIFFLSEKQNKFVRFHAMQAILLGGAVFVLYVVYSFLMAGAVVAAGAAGAGVSGVFAFFYFFIALGFFALWAFCLIMAFTGKWFKIPLIGDMAMKWS